MTLALGQIINVLVFAASAATAWLLPRRFGLQGLIASQVLVAGGFWLMGFVALETGLWGTYDGPLTLIGLLIHAFVLNLLLLPVAAVAMLRRRRE